MCVYIQKAQRLDLVRRPRDLPRRLDRTVTDSGNGIVESERRERVHRAASLGLVPEDVPTRRTHREAPLMRRRRRGDDSAGFGTEERRPEKRGVSAGVILPTAVAAGGGRARRRSDVEEREVGSRSAGDESVGVDRPRRRRRVVGVDHSVNVARRS